MTQQLATVTLPSYQDGGTELWAYLRSMRLRSPVFFDERSQVWHLFGYTEVQRAMLDVVTFRSDMSEILPLQLFSRGNIVQTDPPRHRVLRTLLGHAWAARTQNLVDTRITQIINELLDELDGQDSFDLTAKLTYPLPITVIAELLGVPISDRELFRTWADNLFSLSFDTAYDPELPKAIDAAAAPMTAYLGEHVRDRRKHPREDIISDLVNNQVDGSGLDDQEAVTFCSVLLLAGHITTTLMLGNAVIALHENPGLDRQLRADPSRINSFTDEVLRCRTPFTALTRMTTQDTTIAGHDIPAGRMVTMWLASANRDESQFPDPDRFDPTRSPNQHLSFGHGIHFCMGAPLAMLETDMALRILWERFSEIRLTDGDPPTFFDAPGALGPRRLPITVERVRSSR